MKIGTTILFVTLLLGAAAARAEPVHVAVAANFTAAMQRLAPAFERASGHRLVTSFGASGKLYAQIVNGAPFDVLLSADEATPRRLEGEGYGVAGTRFTYAVGRLVLWSPQPERVDARGEVLTRGDFKHLAIANPKTAPYGAAAERALRSLRAWERIESRLVLGENIAQTLQFIHSGNAELGLVALAQVRSLPPEWRGSHWPVPNDMHPPLRQDALLLTRGADKPGARAFLAFLRTDAARATLIDLGYELP
jgi:molybdate transport system substrate-binding protein